MRNLLFYVALLASGAVADNLPSCPSDSSGNFPNCVCSSGAIYDAAFNWCPSQLTDLKGGVCFWIRK